MNIDKKKIYSYGELPIELQPEASNQVSEIPGFTRWDAVKNFGYTLDKGGKIVRCLFIRSL